MRRISPYLAAALPAILAPAAAQADCFEDPPGSFTIFCLGFDLDTGDLDPTPDGLFDARDGLDIEVDFIQENGPLITDGLVIPGSGNSVYVYGVIEARTGTAILGGPDLTVRLGVAPTPMSSGGSAVIEAGNGIDIGTATGLSVNLAGGGDFDVSGTAIRGGDGASVTGEVLFATGNYRAIDLGDDSSVVLSSSSGNIVGVDISSGGGSAVVLGERSKFSIGAGGSVVGRTSDDPLPGTGVELGSGRFFSESGVAGRGTGGVGLRITGTSGLTTIDNGFEGVLEGDAHALLVEGGDANTSVQQMLNFGSLGDASFGGGDDSLTVADGMASTGVTKFGAGNDLLSLTDTLDGLNDFGLFDGGPGFDDVLFDGFDLADLLDVTDAAGVIRFGFDEGLGLGGPSLFFDLANFESYVFKNASFTDQQFRTAFDLPPAAIPLPAAGWLLAASLCGLVLHRRRPAGT